MLLRLIRAELRRALRQEWSRTRHRGGGATSAGRWAWDGCRERADDALFSSVRGGVGGEGSGSGGGGGGGEVSVGEVGRSGGVGMSTPRHGACLQSCAQGAAADDVARDDYMTEYLMDSRVCSTVASFDPERD